MSKGTRIVVFVAILVALTVIYLLQRPSITGLGEPGIVLMSALLMLAFISLLVEHFFTKPTDVVASTVAILLLLAPLQVPLERFGLWYVLLFSYSCFLLLTSLVSMFLLNPNRPETSWDNRTARVLHLFSVRLGNGKLLWFALFALTLLFYVDSQSNLFLVLFAFSAIVILLDPTKFLNLSWGNQDAANSDIGTIFGVQASNTFLAKLYPNRDSPSKFDCVEFTCGLERDAGSRRGIVLDKYILNSEHWIRIQSDDRTVRALGDDRLISRPTSDVVYKVDVNATAYTDRLVGVVTDKSTIERIRFEYCGSVPVSEGDLLEVKIGTNHVLYQVIEGVTELETLDHKDEAGVIIGEAVQLGTWNTERRAFDRFGWVPAVNSPVVTAVSAQATPSIESSEYQIGTIPNTNFPVVLDLDDAVSHHMSVLGVTGSGKSVFSRNLIRQLVAHGTKVICVDFTNEYSERLVDLKLNPVVSSEREATLFASVDQLSVELEKFPNQRNKAAMSAAEESLRNGFKEALKDFLTSADRRACLFELPDVSNTTGILEYTRWFFKAQFELAKDDGNFGQKVCIVLEEAHTIIPEWNFIGVDDKRAGSLVNSISQIALQGRKYGIGFLVIAQRTANVSKTVLTQCNSVVAFQQFDKTSGEFLGNYMGSDFVDTLTRLKPRHAIAVGKAFTSGTPIIFEVPTIEEPGT